MAVDLTQVSHVETEPGELPKTMAAWVIRQEREGEPMDAFQVEEIEVPEPEAFEVIVRVMAAGVNFNNVWAALGKPVSVFRYHPEEDHHIGGSDASGIVWKVGEGVTKWRPGDEVVIHCNQASYEDAEVHGPDPLAAQAVGVVSSPEKGELLERIGITGWIDRNEFAGMMRKGGESPDEEKARFKESRRFSKTVAEMLGGAPDIVFEHVGQATFPTSVL